MLLLLPHPHSLLNPTQLDFWSYTLTKVPMTLPTAISTITSQSLSWPFRQHLMLFDRHDFHHHLHIGLYRWPWPHSYQIYLLTGYFSLVGPWTFETQNLDPWIFLNLLSLFIPLISCDTTLHSVTQTSRYPEINLISFLHQLSNTVLHLNCFPCQPPFSMFSLTHRRNIGPASEMDSMPPVSPAQIHCSYPSLSRFCPWLCFLPGTFFLDNFTLSEVQSLLISR